VVTAAAAASRTNEAPPHVFGYPTRVPPFVTVHQPRYLINKGMAPPPTPARHFSNNSDDDDGRITCVVYIYIYGAYDYYYYYHYYKRQEYHFSKRNIRVENVLLVIIYIITLPVCTDGARNTPWCTYNTIHTYYMYTYWYNILVLYTHYIYHIVRVLRHTLRMRRGKRYYSNVSTARDRYPVWRRFPARRRSVYTRCSIQGILSYIGVDGFSDKYFVCTTPRILARNAAA